MKRDPSLHITKSNLVRILNQIEYIVRTSKQSLAESIFELSIPYQLKDRYLQILEQKQPTKKKIQRSEKASIEVTEQDVKLFNKVLFSVRSKLNNHILIKPILQDSKDYLMLKEITVLAVRFCENFNIESRKDGFTEYVVIGLDLMQKYSLNRFKYYDSKINENLQNRVLLANDESKEQTLEFKEMLVVAMVHYSGLDFFIKDNEYEALINIYYARKQADEEKADYEDWIIAQFEGLAFLNVIPELNQFYGDGAKNRWKKYIKSKGLEENQESITKQFKDYDEA